MNNLDLIVRTVGVTAALILALSMMGSRGAPWVSRICGALLCLGVAAYLSCSANWEVCWHPAWLPAASLASAVPFFFWAWTRSITDDDFRLTAWPIAVAVVLLAMPLCMQFVAVALRPTHYVGWSVILHSLLGIAFVVAALFGVVRTWRQDMIEARRRLRWIVVVVSGVYSIVVMCVELYFHDKEASSALELLNAMSLTLLLLVLCGVLLSVSDGMRTAFGWVVAQDVQLPSVQPATVNARDVEQELVDKLQAQMTNQAAYRDANLAVSMLASTLGVHEKRLREIINGRLGFKNFPSFVNAYRLEEVRLRLADARHDRLPILTLALDAGFGSIVVFNRTFKERYSMTPTEYRALRTGTTS